MTNVTKHSEIVKMVEEFKNLTKHTNGELCLLAGEGKEQVKIKDYQDIGKFFNIKIEYDDHNVLCYYDPETEGWEALEDCCAECGDVECSCDEVHYKDDLDENEREFEN
jgi:hypothetical protein